eukprot:3249586-Rhodomonas_salina.4
MNSRVCLGPGLPGMCTGKAKSTTQIHAHANHGNHNQQDRVAQAANIRQPMLGQAVVPQPSVSRGNCEVRGPLVLLKSRPARFSLML